MTSGMLRSGGITRRERIERGPAPHPPPRAALGDHPLRVYARAAGWNAARGLDGLEVRNTRRGTREREHFFAERLFSHLLGDGGGGGRRGGREGDKAEAGHLEWSGRCERTEEAGMGEMCAGASTWGCKG